ncbi:MAG: hypothetical protein HOD92_09375 [Deltaproteobacteria bacterium]|jgi:hypothetical protein|nr:hypothetical protein [Deltaproteobacteria bacterium]
MIPAYEPESVIPLLCDKCWPLNSLFNLNLVDDLALGYGLADRPQNTYFKITITICICVEHIRTLSVVEVSSKSIIVTGYKAYLVIPWQVFETKI